MNIETVALISFILVCGYTLYTIASSSLDLIKE